MEIFAYLSSVRIARFNAQYGRFLSRVVYIPAIIKGYLDCNKVVYVEDCLNQKWISERSGCDFDFNGGSLFSFTCMFPFASAVCTKRTTNGATKWTTKRTTEGHVTFYSPYIDFRAR